MRQVTILAIILCSATMTQVIGQTPLEKYANHPKTEIDFETSLVTEQIILVSPKNPLIIKSPNKNETFKIYVFTKIWENEKFKAFVGLSDDPFKPNLVITDNGQTEIDKIQLLGNHGQAKPGYEPIEQAKILSDKEIILIVNIHTWALDSNGQKIKGTEKIETKIDKYRITDTGKIERYLEK